MKKNGLKERLITSFILILIVLLIFFSNKYLWTMLASFVSLISYIEFDNLFSKIKKIKNNFRIYFQLLVFLYFTFLIYISFNIYDQYLLYVILICILSDTGGYFVGKTFGGIKLTKISPKKTISGAIGSVIFSIFPIIYLILTENKEFFVFQYLNENNLFYLFIFSCILSITCQIGDLIISFLKRKANLKDTGNILPGHGGLLDRIDGIIFVIPISYIMQNFFQI